MKKLMLALFGVVATLSLTACAGKGKGGGDTFVTSPNSCFNYIYNHQTGQYYDQHGRVVQCNPGHFGNGFNQFAPYNQYWQGQMYSGCSSWSSVYPDSQYVPVVIQGYGAVCVKVGYFNTLPGFSYYFNYYGTYPMYARSCQFGVNCGGCYHTTRQVDAGPFWLGGTLALCW